MIAVVPVSAGVLPAGALDAALEAGGTILLVGDGTQTAAAELARLLASVPPFVTATLGPARPGPLRTLEAGPFAPGRFASLVAEVVPSDEVVVLPACPDGRDLAPRLAAVLERPLLGVAMEVRPGGARVLRSGGRQVVELSCGEPFVATLLPGAVAPLMLAGSDERVDSDAAGALLPEPEIARVTEEALPEAVPTSADAEVLAVLEPDPSTVDLSEATRIVGGGAGLGGEEEFALAAAVARRLGASLGATRVVTDAGVLGHDRQIGTTGMAVNPRTYLAFGVSGAAQHVGGLGTPEHIVSVNLDPSCPMTAMAEVGIVADAAATLRALAARLETVANDGTVADDGGGAHD